MSRKLHSVFAILGIVLATCQSIAEAKEGGGHGAGNGGDLIRAAFISTGQEIARTLKGTSEGRRLAADHNIDTVRMESLLTISFIKVVQGPLKDNGGSDVDAVGSESGITLEKTSWSRNVMHSKDFRKIVFHELLRALSVNDDNYVVSSKLPPESPRGGISAFFLDGGFKILREEFEESAPMAREDVARWLKSAGTGLYACVEFETLKKENRRFRTSVRPFRKKGVNLQISGWLYVEDVSAIFSFSEFGLTGVLDELQSNWTSGLYGGIRFDSQGGFIMEEMVVSSEEYAHLPESLTIPQLKAQAYVSCEPLAPN